MCKGDLRSPRDVTQRCLVVADVSRRPICPVFKGKAIQGDVTERLPQMSVTNYQSTLRNASDDLRISTVWPNGYCDARKKPRK